jgi:hypothetical protein
MKGRHCFCAGLVVAAEQSKQQQQQRLPVLGAMFADTAADNAADMAA